MTDRKTNASVFISYAWGGPLEKKEWLREQVVNPLQLHGFDVFWDRDSLLFGQHIDQAIRKALAVRPLTVVCLCDAHYIEAAKRLDSGLYSELAMIAEIAGDDQVGILPVILEQGCGNGLPAVLNGRVSLDASRLPGRQSDIGTVLGAALRGATQVEVAALIDHLIRIASLWARARQYFGNEWVGFKGDARTHVVRSADGKLLLPPAWMHRVIHWSNRMADDVPGFCPAKGIWHWDHWTPSTGMRALGAAAMSAFFPDKTSEEEIGAIEHGGDILAVRVIAMTKKTEHLRFDWQEMVQCMSASEDGLRSLERLLPREGQARELPAGQRI